MNRFFDDRLSGIELLVLVVFGITVVSPFSCWRLEDDQRTPISVWFFGNPEHAAVLERVLDEYERQHTHVRLTLHRFPGKNYMQKLLPAMQAGAAGDVLYLHWSMITELAAKDALVPLNELVERDRYSLDDFFAGSTYPYTIGGQLFAIPFKGSTMVVFYNKDLFDAAGLAYPNDDWTRDDFLGAARKLTIYEDGRPKQVGCVPEEPTSWIYSAGGDFASDDLKRLSFTDPRTLDALRFYVDLKLKYNVTPRNMDAFGQDPTGVDQFETGRVGMNISGPWELETYGYLENLRWDVALFPEGPAGRRTRYAGTGFGVWAGSNRREAAWDVVKFLCGPVAGRLVAASPSDVPARRSIAYSPVFLRPEYEWDMTVFLRAMEPEHATLGTFPRSPLWNIIRRQFTEHLDEVLVNGADLTATMQKLERRVRDYVDQRQP